MIVANPSDAADIVRRWREATTWQSSVAPKESALLEKVLVSALAPHFPGAILPWPRDGKRTIFYGIASTNRDWRLLRPLLLGAGGPTLTGFTGLTELPNAKWGAPEALLDECGFTAMARLVSDDTPDCRALLLRALARLCRLVDENPTPPRGHAESTGRLIARLDGALADCDRQTAMGIFERLRTEDRLDGLNLSYLKVQLAAAFRDWPAIIEMPELQDLITSPRPAAVTSALLEAYAAAYSIDSEDSLALLEPVRALLQDLLEPPLPQLGPGATRVIELLRESTNVRWSSLISDDKEVGQPDELTSRLETARTLLILATRSFSLASASVALKAVEALSEADRAQLLGVNWAKEMWRDLTRRGGTVTAPESWCDWLTCLERPEFTDSIEFARQAASEWSIEEKLGNADEIDKLSSQLSLTRSSLAEERLAEALPVIVSWLRRDANFPRTSFLPIYDTLWTLLVLGVGRGQAELESTMILFDGLLQCAMPSRRYQELLRDALDLAADPGRRSAYWMLGMIESTAEHSAPNSAARQNFWLAALDRLDRFRGQLSAIQQLTISRLAGTLGVADFDRPSQNVGIGGLARALEGKRIAIYTLTESAGKQAIAALNDAAPGVRLSLHSDHVGSPSLKAAAENVDLFIIVTWSATHAATDFIRKHRPADKTMLYAPGRGTSAILRTVDDFLSLQG